MPLEAEQDMVVECPNCTVLYLEPEAVMCTCEGGAARTSKGFGEVLEHYSTIGKDVIGMFRARQEICAVLYFRCPRHTNNNNNGGYSYYSLP